MKRAILGVFAAAAVLSAATVPAFAASPRCGCRFVDADGDGVCDRVRGACLYADADGDGVCDLCGVGHGLCLTDGAAGFVDADGDGVCDSCGAYHRCGAAGAGRGQNFVDADGDGICDNAGTGLGQANGQGGGRAAGGARGSGFRGGPGQ